MIVCRGLFFIFVRFVELCHYLLRELFRIEITEINTDFTSKSLFGRS